MTTVEMQIEVKVGLDKQSSFQYPDLQPEVIDLFLNRSQDIIVEQINKAKLYNEIQEIIIFNDLAITKLSTSIFGNKCYLTTTGLNALTNYIYHAESNVYVTRLNFPVVAVKESVSNHEITVGESKFYRVDTYNKPIFESPKVFLYGGVFYVLVDGYTTIDTTMKFNLRYVRKPVRIVSVGTLVNCELNDKLHRKIVDLCVNLLLENIESPRLETNTQQLAEKL